jgi:hypothetical protein
MARSAGLFDIVNGFFNRCRGDMGLIFMRFRKEATEDWFDDRTQQDYLAEFNNRMIGAVLSNQGCRWWCGLSSVR